MAIVAAVHAVSLEHRVVHHFPHPCVVDQFKLIGEFKQIQLIAVEFVDDVDDALILAFEALPGLGATHAKGAALFALTIDYPHVNWAPAYVFSNERVIIIL